MARTDIKVRGYNDAPSAKAIAEYLDSNNLDHCFVVADAKKQYWQNDEATLVLRQARIIPGFNVAFKLGNMPWHFRADEFDTMKEDGNTFYRIWWD